MNGPAAATRRIKVGLALSADQARQIAGRTRKSYSPSGPFAKRGAADSGPFGFSNWSRMSYPRLDVSPCAVLSGWQKWTDSRVRNLKKAKALPNRQNFVVDRSAVQPPSGFASRPQSPSDKRASVAYPTAAELSRRGPDSGQSVSFRASADAVRGPFRRNGPTPARSGCAALAGCLARRCHGG